MEVRKLVLEVCDVEFIGQGYQERVVGDNM